MHIKLINVCGRCLVGRVFWNGLLVYQPGFAVLPERGFPAVVAGSAYAEVSACLAHITDLLSMPQHFELALIMAVAPLKIFRALKGLNR